MEIFGDAGAKLAFSGRAGSPLAWIVEADRLARRSRSRRARSPRQCCAARARRVRARRGAVRAQLEDGERSRRTCWSAPTARFARAHALGLRGEEQPYGEAALVANFETEREHGDVARQWFRADGVLAWLPLPGGASRSCGRRRARTPTSSRRSTTRALRAPRARCGRLALGDLRSSRGGALPAALIRVERTVRPASRSWAMPRTRCIRSRGRA
jgi:2-octaprenyl-6-methoxyphenol hydroxylase